MAKRAEQARADVMDTIIKAFKDVDAFEVCADKKIYVWAQDGAGGEKIEFAISITAPKTPVFAGTSVSSNEAAWENAPQSGSPQAPVAQPTQLSDEDKAKVQDLMRQLGLS